VPMKQNGGHHVTLIDLGGRSSRLHLRFELFSKRDQPHGHLGGGWLDVS
jgi:hypothetical protein